MHLQNAWEQKSTDKNWTVSMIHFFFWKWPSDTKCSFMQFITFNSEWIVYIVYIVLYGDTIQRFKDLVHHTSSSIVWTNLKGWGGGKQQYYYRVWKKVTYFLENNFLDQKRDYWQKQCAITSKHRTQWPLVWYFCILDQIRSVTRLRYIW